MEILLTQYDAGVPGPGAIGDANNDVLRCFQWK